MATLPTTRGRRRRRNMGNESQKLKTESATSSILPSWCSSFRKESLDSERAYDERVTTSTKTSEIRLRQESVRYWNRFLEEAEAAAFSKIVHPTCQEIQDILFDDLGGIGLGSGENENKGSYKFGMNDDLTDIGGEKRESNHHIHDDTNNIRNKDSDWEYCQKMFGLPSASKRAQTIPNHAEKIETPSKKSISSSAKHLRICYPFEVLPVFVITSPLISNCLQDRSKICHSMWKQLNGLECTIGTKQSSSSAGQGDGGKQSDSFNSGSKGRSICIYIPRLLSSLTETLQVLWDGLLSHYENTHDAPSMDPDDPHYYSNPNDISSKRHSYHVSKRRHYEALLNRKVTTESQKSKIGTKKQQSLQDFILEFLHYIYEETEDLSEQGGHDQMQENSTVRKRKREKEKGLKRKYPMRGNLIVLLEDPRMLHSKVPTAHGQGSVGGSNSKLNNSRLIQSQLLETLASWREIHGIPVSLVVFHSVGSKHEVLESNILLNPSFESSVNGGRFGIQTIRCSIPSSVPSIDKHIPPSMAFGVWSHYFLQATMKSPLPLMAPQRYPGQQIKYSTVTDIVLRMCRDSLSNESSCSRWISSIRSRLALQFYTLKGSFVWDALNPNAANMLRRTPLLPKKENGSERNTTNDNNTNDNTTMNNDKRPFVIGNDDVQIFQPEFVAWFCSYHKAHTLLSSQSGEEKASMNLWSKCDALLKCYGLLLAPIEKKEEENPLKRRKVSSREYKVRDTEGGGTLQFWWTISCSLLPLYFLSLTVGNEGMILSSTHQSSNQSTANGSTKKSNNCHSEGESMWVLERLAEVYGQLLAVTEKRDNCESMEFTSTSFDADLADKTTVSLMESGLSASTDGPSINSVEKDLLAEASEKNLKSHDKRRLENDFVDVTLRRYLQRGTKEACKDTIRNIECLSSSHGEIMMNEAHREGVRKLTTMVQETIVLVAAIPTNKQKVRSSANNIEDDLLGDNKIRLGVTETILEMTFLALRQVEAWTRQWIDLNPLMSASMSEQGHLEGCMRNTIDDVNQLHRFESRPLNFRRRILENLPLASMQLYEALEGRLSIDRDDWFRSFDGSAEDFLIGVWTLRKCGLIQPKKTTTTSVPTKYERSTAKKRQEVVLYEKVAVVWC